MRPRWWAGLVLATALAEALVAGCGGETTAGGVPTSEVPSSMTSASVSGGAGPSAAVPAPASASPSAGAPAPTPPVGTRPVVQCLNGTYRLTRLTDATPGARYPTVAGGDVELRFSGQEFPDGNYVGTAYGLDAPGRRALTLTGVDGATSSLVVKARAQGSYTLEDSQGTFVRGPGTGSGRLTAGGRKTTLDLAAVQELVAPAGLLTVSCTRSTLWLTGTSVQYEFRTS